MNKLFVIGKVIEKTAAWSILVLLVFVISNCSYSLHIRKNELRDQAAKIQNRCRLEKGCPSKLQGWRELKPGVYSNNGIRYQVAKDRNSFQLVGYVGPDWDYIASGGVTSELKYEDKL